MTLSLALLRVVLAGVFAVAAAAKLASRDRSRETLRAFGVPGPVASPLGAALPVAEAAIAVALLVDGSARVGAVGAAALLAIFSTAIGVNLARGRRPDCNCFGAVHSKPIGPTTLVRNAGLAAVAVLVAAAGSGASLFAWLGRLSTADLVLTIVVAALSLCVAALIAFGFGLFRRYGALLLRLDALETGAPAAAPDVPGLPVGATAPDFALAGLDGETMTLAALRAPGRPVLLLFTDPGCGPCNLLLPEIGDWQRAHERTLTLALMSRRSADDNRPKSKEHGLVNVFLQADNEVADAYDVSATPGAVLVTADGFVGSSVALGADEIRALVQATVPRPAPDFALPDLEGRVRSLTEFRGRELLLVFWNPGCGFCEAMTNELQRLDAIAGQAGIPELLVLTTAAGTPELHAPVLIDDGAVVAGRFGAGGTPMAVRVDASGAIASPVAAGAEGVIELAEPVRPTLVPAS